MSFKITLRDYQREAVQSVIDAQREKLHSCLVSLPVGAGKTVVMAELSRRFRVPTLLLCHRDELLKQAASKFQAIYPEAKLGFIKGSEFDPQFITFASVQTLKNPKKLNRLPKWYKLIITDEAHHATASSYKKIFEALPDAFNVGVTATPDRSDGVSLGTIYEKMVYHKSMLSMIQSNYLTPLKGYVIKTSTDINSVNTKNGDFEEASLARVINVENRNELIVEAYRRYALGRKAVIFAVNVEHSKALAKAFNDAGFPAAHLSGADKRSYREEVLRRFTPKGDLQILSNVGILTEGFDEPSIGCVILARPTQSMPLYIQIIGRGTRLYPTKKECIVLDFVDVTSHAKIMILPELFRDQEMVRVKRKKEEEQSSDETQPTEDSATTTEEVEEVLVGTELIGVDSQVVASSDYVWSIFGSDYRLNLFGNKELVVSLLDDGNASIQFRHEDSVTVIEESMNFGYAIAYAEQLAGEYSDNLGAMKKTAKWRKQPATPSQIEKLDKWGIIYGKDITKGEASDLIGRYVYEIRQKYAQNQ